MNFTVEIIVIFAMIIFNAIFAAYEMALASITRTKLTFLVQKKRKGATEALFMKDRMEASLAVVQLGITLVGAIAAATGGSGINEQLTPYLETRYSIPNYWAVILSLAILIIPLSALTIIFAELIPKTFALKHSEWVVLKLSKTMKYFTIIAYPIIASLENITKAVMRFLSKRAPKENSSHDPQSSLHELTAALSVARTSRLIDAQQEKIVLAAAQLSLRPIKSIMIPSAEISVIPQKSTLSEALIRAHLDMHTRFPVCEVENDLQTIQGYINFKDIMAALKINPNDPTIKGIIRPLTRFMENTPISEVFTRMIQEKLHISLVEDSKGKIIGLVTQEDIIEELVGDIEDEYDRLPHHIYPYGNQWIVGGAVPMSSIAKTLGIIAPADEADIKLTDWCQKYSTKTLVGGETINGSGFEVTVRKMKRRKISEAFIAKNI
jgi:putative hemolysin